MRSCAAGSWIEEFLTGARLGVERPTGFWIGGKVAGIAVHTGARVATHAQTGEVLDSSTVKYLVAGSGLTFQDRGMQRLKGIPDEWRLFAVQ
jgi:class 3 adenylate cyclase